MYLLLKFQLVLFVSSHMHVTMVTSVNKKQIVMECKKSDVHILWRTLLKFTKFCNNSFIITKMGSMFRIIFIIYLNIAY